MKENRCPVCNTELEIKSTGLRIYGLLYDSYLCKICPREILIGYVIKK